MYLHYTVGTKSSCNSGYYNEISVYETVYSFTLYMMNANQTDPCTVQNRDSKTRECERRTDKTKKENSKRASCGQSLLSTRTEREV